VVLQLKIFLYGGGDLFTVISAPAGLLLPSIPLMRLIFAWQATSAALQAILVAVFKEIFLWPKLVESYKEILVIACEEASEWSMSNPRLDVDLTCLESAALEQVLQKRGMPIHVWIFALLQ
jgi:hypothetical protein